MDLPFLHRKHRDSSEALPTSALRARLPGAFVAPPPKLKALGVGSRQVFQYSGGGVRKNKRSVLTLPPARVPRKSRLLGTRQSAGLFGLELSRRARGGAEQTPGRLGFVGTPWLKAVETPARLAAAAKCPCPGQAGAQPGAERLPARAHSR